MDIPEEQLSEKYEMMDWMSAGSPENTGLLRERDRVSGKMTPSDAGRRQVHYHVELPEEVNAQDETLHVFHDEIEGALVQSQLVVFEMESECSLWTSGDCCSSGSGEEAAS